MDYKHTTKYNASFVNCCTNCGKSYKKRENLTKHLVLCDLLNTRTIEEDEIELPSQKKMFQMLLELGKKYTKLEEQMSEITKWVSKKKKKINVIEWLNTNVVCKTDFKDFISNCEWLTIEESDIEDIMKNTFFDTMNRILSKTLFAMKDEYNSVPIFAFSQKVNTLYAFQRLVDDESEDSNGWKEITREMLIKWFNRMHIQFLKVFTSWRKKNTEKGVNNDTFEINCDKSLMKLMSVDFSVESAFSKMKSIVYNGLKTDMKALIEYEFEF
jgi:hypothetical protein